MNMLGLINSPFSLDVASFMKLTQGEIQLISSALETRELAVV